MVTILKAEWSPYYPEAERRIYIKDAACNSSDEKPTQVSGAKVRNGSVIREVNTGKVFQFDEEYQAWCEA